jgi:hypothetical protein
VDESSTPTQSSSLRHQVITVHGIRTFGEWQDRLGKLLEQAEPGISVHHYRYGYFSVVAFMVPLLRWFVVRKFRDDLRDLLRRDPEARVDLVGHSFGTHLIAHALRGLHSEGLNFRIHTVLLAGSVLKVDFPRRSLSAVGMRRWIPLGRSASIGSG